MRKQIVTVVAAAAVGVSGVAIAGPALAAAGAPGAAAAVTSRVDRVKQALSGLVSDGTLTQAQADKVASTLGSADLGGPGRGRHAGGRDLQAAATALGMTEADLRTALQGGKTLAQVAKDKGVSVDKLVQALVDAEKARIAQAVTAGRLTQAQADQRLAGLTARVTAEVNGARPAGRWHGGDRPGAGAGAGTGAPSGAGAGAPVPSPTA